MLEKRNSSMMGERKVRILSGTKIKPLPSELHPNISWTTRGRV
jgi:hypothetical protein